MNNLSNALLSLEFCFEDRPELVETTFRRSRNSPEITCRRAKHQPLGIGRFEWGSGVQALCFLLLKYILASKTGDVSQFRILSNNSREKGKAPPVTPITAFDYILSKRKNILWVCDIFGVFDSGKPFAQNIFIQTNPGGKRKADEIGIGINYKLLPPDKIELIWNKTRTDVILVKDPLDLQILCDKIELQWAENRKNYKPQYVFVTDALKMERRR